MSFLTLSRIEKTFSDGTRAVQGIDLSVSRGELIVLLGPSGCGKTTTLRMTAGLEIPTAGAVVMDGRDVTRLRPSERDVGMVFQFYALYLYMNVEQNIAFPLQAAGLDSAEIKQRVSAAIERIGLERKRKLYPRQLSGGDQQKVSLARAMVRRPAAYLMDEPLGTLDAGERVSMREFIRSRQIELRVTTLYVTHDQEEAMSLADRIVVMEGGTIRQVGSPAEVYDRPGDLFVASFVGSPSMNCIAGEVIQSEGRTRFVSERGNLEVALPPSHQPGRATLGIRSEHVREDPAGALAGRVTLDEYLGSARNTHIQADFGRIIMRSAAAPGHPAGSLVRFSLDPSRISLFDTVTGMRL
ncbi:MAG TPA: ABC transporter ATP-binding protein [Polyangiaceae bacterium]|jgi:ABC-type sugar transport system ATPase subunit